MKSTKYISLITVFLAFLLLSFSDPSLKKRITDTEFRYEFYTTNKKPTVRPNRFYYWFKGGAIHASEYGISGYLLDGAFEKFYLNNQIAEQGDFKKGLKVGLWKTWHPNGNLHSSVRWIKGIKSGVLYLYDEKGTLLEKGRYFNNKKQGSWYDFKRNEIISYSKGVEILKEPIKSKAQKAKEKEQKKIENDKIKNDSNNKSLVQRKNNKKQEQSKKMKAEKVSKDNFLIRLFSKKNKTAPKNAKSQ